MSAASTSRMQDLPPKGGYAPFQTERVKLRSVLNAKSCFGLVLGSTLFGMYSYYKTFIWIKRHEIEMRSAHLAIWPLLLAERDRAVLKQMRYNRETEAELMKNIEKWEVGTYYGEPIFFLDKEDQYRDPLFSEHFAHTHPDDFLIRSARHLVT
ncbi:NADH dehydrogenase [ubiquinone] 1 alpha subcomplex subunit 13 [Harpegnathos saltator]|uniref:NADH dehydrogenase [ubiquinone] 1 alpha subcomplex subunit 13 n=1 Tax=Harpegnathos saltator TaxID=610380 RepID=E2BN37_HARSA|nr:NADH dehydrogenase [ubiquinone] 1 alpha subcomplex subunit 13 [Harpegnathos saltator]EFN82941.1 NADH dehydrogenase [ubiquinone] 1 alpha subcomplex subunit 13 [Harpegnathos saltator]